MSALFSKPQLPEVRSVDPLPPPPERTSTETSALAEQQRARFAKRGGRSSTFLSGARSRGAGGSQGAASVRFLGGAAGT